MLQQAALRVHYTDGREERACGRLGALRNDLLTERLPVAPESWPPPKEVRPLITVEQCETPGHAVADAGPLSGQAQRQLATHQLKKPEPAAYIRASLLQKPSLWDEPQRLKFSATFESRGNQLEYD